MSMPGSTRLKPDGQQKADLKRKFSRMDALSKTGQAIRAKAFDI